MSYTLEVRKGFIVRQGLRSPVRAGTGVPNITEFQVILRAGIAFTDNQVNERGWFVDSDAFDVEVMACAEFLASDTWTKLFSFRPTFEVVSRWIYMRLHAKAPQLEYIELDNVTLGVTTRYKKD